MRQDRGRRRLVGVGVVVVLLVALAIWLPVGQTWRELTSGPLGPVAEGDDFRDCADLPDDEDDPVVLVSRPATLRCAVTLPFDDTADVLRHGFADAGPEDVSLALLGYVEAYGTSVPGQVPPVLWEVQRLFLALPNPAPHLDDDTTEAEWSVDVLTPVAEALAQLEPSRSPEQQWVLTQRRLHLLALDPVSVNATIDVPAELD